MKVCEVVDMNRYCNCICDYEYKENDVVKLGSFGIIFELFWRLWII